MGNYELIFLQLHTSTVFQLLTFCSVNNPFELLHLHLQRKTKQNQIWIKVFYFIRKKEVFDVLKNYNIAYLDFTIQEERAKNEMKDENINEYKNIKLILIIIIIEQNYERNTKKIIRIYQKESHRYERAK